MICLIFILVFLLVCFITVNKGIYCSKKAEMYSFIHTFALDICNPNSISINIQIKIKLIFNSQNICNYDQLSTIINFETEFLRITVIYAENALLSLKWNILLNQEILCRVFHNFSAICNEKDIE